MKRIISLICVFVIMFLLTGCTSDSMENITIYTSVYPVEFVTERLYKGHAKVYSMYPRGISPYTYKLTNKQITDYGESDLVIYNGLSDEKDYIVKMLNNNKNLKIIDSTNNIEYTYSLDEIWMNPSNVLMIAQNIREGLKEYVNSTLLSEEIDANYEELKINISSIDADLKEMVENASDKTIVVQNDEFTFLNKYGLNVVSLDEKTITDKVYSDTVKLIGEGNIKNIYIIKGQKENESVKKIMKEYPDLNIVELDPINNISTEDKNNDVNYITIMNENIDKLKQELY